MNKLINSSESQSQQLPIVAGNDFSINVVITELNKETGSWDRFVLTAAMSPTMYLVSSNGKRINTKATLENNGSLTAEIPGYYLTKSAYGVEILFMTEGRNRRTYAPDLFKIVTTTEAANSGIDTYNTTDPYRFNLKLEADIAWLNIGSLPSEYVTEDELSYTLSSYATNSSVETQINSLWRDCNDMFIDNDELAYAVKNFVTYAYLDSQSYATVAYVADAIANIPTGGDVTYEFLSTQSYVTLPSLVDMSYAKLTDLSSYVKTDDLNNTLSSYVTYTYLESQSYVTSSSLDTTLSSYAQLSDLNSYAKTSDLDSYAKTSDLDSYVTLTTNQTISGAKTFTVANKFTEETTFEYWHPTNASYTFDIIDGCAKSSKFSRGMFNQICIGDVLLPNKSHSVSSTKENTTKDTLTIRKVNSHSGGNPTSLTQLAKIDDNGIYEGTTLLSDKYAQLSYLSSYVSYAYLDSQSYAKLSDLSSYVSQTSLDSTLTSYVSQTSLDSTLSSYVQSSTIHNIWSGSQADYDLLTPDANTLYVIV